MYWCVSSAWHYNGGVDTISYGKWNLYKMHTQFWNQLIIEKNIHVGIHDQAANNPCELCLTRQPEVEAAVVGFGWRSWKN